ncbi:MAG: type II secretion system protein [Patescibacteria group bacterium]
MREIKKRIQHRLKNGAGFTLIELLVVISLIGILMGILLVAYQGTRKSARDGRRKADLEQIRSALEMCRTDKGSYPVGSSLPSAGGVDCSNYLPSVPKDPLDPTYLYPYTGTANTYTLCAYLETGTGTVAGCGSCGSSTCNYKVTNP